MTYEEANQLKTSNSTIIYGEYEEGGFLNYWLGSAYSDDCAFGVFGLGNGDVSGGIWIDTNDKYGVRPVLEVSESSIEL